MAFGGKTMWRAAALALAAWAWCNPALGQRQIMVPDNPANNVDNGDARESNEGVYVPESELAMEKLTLAEKMERLKEWNKSADLYQEVLSDPKYAAKVVPSKENAEHRVYQYTSVEERVMQRLARWPQEGLSVYRARYETPAAALLESAKGDDLVTLHRLISRYFVTDAGKTAGLRLVDHYLESGEFRAASAIGDRLLQWHPNIEAERPGLLFRTAIAYHLAGDQTDSQSRLDELRRRDPQARGIVRGHEVILADALATELRQAPPTVTGSSADSYTTFGGDASRNRILSASSTPGAHLYSIALSKPAWLSGQQNLNIEVRYKADVKNGMTLGVMPVVDRGELFFQDGQCVYAINLESGVPLAGWLQTHGSDHDGAYVLPNPGTTARTHQLTLTVTDRCVLAVLGRPDASLSRFGVPTQGEGRLVCLDRESGKENWIFAPSQVKQEVLRSLQLCGSPLVVGDNVLIAGQARKEAGFEDCYVLCLDLAKGGLRWATNVASASTIAGGWPAFNPNYPVMENETHLAYANGRVFVQTNRGAVAALDAYNGTIIWLDIYSRGQPGTPSAGPMFFQPGIPTSENRPRPWEYNPVIVSQGMVFTLPLEGKALLIYDAATGDEVRHIRLDELGQQVAKADIVNVEDFDTLVGVIDDRLVLTGTNTLVVLNWKKYDPDHFNDDMLVWIEGWKPSVRGRPLLTDRSIYVSSEDRLFRHDLRTGIAVDTHPDQHRETWDESEGPGNVLVISDHTIIAGADRVDVYTDLAAAKSRLDREVAEAPGDPQPRLRYAEVMYAAGDYETSLAKITEAIDRIGGIDAMQVGPARDRVFNDCVSFAQKLKGDPSNEARQRVEKLFDLAAHAAASPRQQVNYRVARATWDETKGDLAAAVTLYQQVLGDADLRSVPLPDESSRGPASADVVTRKRIAQLIKRDATVYQPFEKQAAAALQEAQDSKDPAKLLEVAQSYPNASIASRAMLLAATAFEDAGDRRSARHALLDLYFNQDRQSSERAQVLEALARTDPRSAAHMLSQGVTELNDPKLQRPLKLADGSEIAVGTKFSEALETVRKAAYQEESRALPTLQLPVPQPQQRPYPKPFLPVAPTIANVNALVLPLRDFARQDRLVTWSSAPLLSVYPAGSVTSLASTNQMTEQPKGCAWIGKDLLVWGQTQLALFKGGGLEAAWKVEVTRLPEIEVVASEPPAIAEPPALNENARINAALLQQQRLMMLRNGRMGIVAPPAPPPPRPAVPAGPEQIDQVAPAGGHILLSTTTGRVLSVEVSGGRIAWQTRPTDRPIDRLIADEDFTIVKSTDDVNVQITVLDTFTGHVRGAKSFARSTNSVPQNVALSPDGSLVFTLPDRICIKDLYKPWADKYVEKPLPSQGTFNGMTGPDQLLISEGRVVALTDSGSVGASGEKYARIYSIETGEPIMLNFGQGQQVERALSAGSKARDVSLRMIGPRLYLVAPDSCNRYNLDRPEEHESLYGGDLTPVSGAMLGSDFLVFIGDDPDAIGGPNGAPAAAPPQVRSSCELYIFGRYQTPHGESGRLDYQVKIADPSGITTSWQAFAGGLCYLTADHQLHLLLGASK